MQQASLERPSSVNLEDYIVVAPSDSGKEVEYCVQDESRPKLFPLWGYVVPVGRAVTSLLSGLMDNYTDNSIAPDSTKSYEPYPVSLERVPSDVSEKSEKDFTSMDPLVTNASQQSNPSDANGIDVHPKRSTLTDSGSYNKRRQSLKKSNAMSSFGACESDTHYMLQKFKLVSRENSTEDYLMLKVKTKSTGSTDSLLSPSTPDTSLDKYLSTIEKDSPFYSDSKSSVRHDKCAALTPPQLAGQTESLLLKRPNGYLMKSYSEPTRTDFVSEDSLLKVERPSSLTVASVARASNCAREKTPSESELKSIVKKHCDEFMKYSNWETLLPLLESEGLLDPITREKLINQHITHQEKSIHFYFTTLPSQGRSAYTSFYRCIVKEKEHRGHRTLQEYFLCHS